MFDFFKSKEQKKIDEYVTHVGRLLFQQISSARDEVRAGCVLVEEFNTRINDMYTAGYIIGFIEDFLSEIFDDEKMMKKYTVNIVTGFFPSSGFKLIESKIAARMMGETISVENKQYCDVYLKCVEFDFGVSSAQLEVSEYQVSKKIPSKLQNYLITGKTE